LLQTAALAKKEHRRGILSGKKKKTTRKKRKKAHDRNKERGIVALKAGVHPSIHPIQNQGEPSRKKKTQNKNQVHGCFSCRRALMISSQTVAFITQAPDYPKRKRKTPGPGPVYDGCF